MVVDLTPWQTPSIVAICIHKSIGYVTLANTVGSREWCCWVGPVTLSLVMELWWSVTAADWLEQRPRCKKWSFTFKTLRANGRLNKITGACKITIILGHLRGLSFISWTSSFVQDSALAFYFLFHIKFLLCYSVTKVICSNFTIYCINLMRMFTSCFVFKAVWVSCVEDVYILVWASG